MEEHIVKQLLELLDTLQVACVELFRYAQEEQDVSFQLTAADMEQGLSCLLRCSQKPAEEKDNGCVKLYPMVQSILHSLQTISFLYRTDYPRCCSKIEYELFPLIQEAKLNFYFFGYAACQEDTKKKYYQEDMIPLSANSYIDEAMETGHYRYEVSLVVLAYNKLDYTKRCVESLLKNIPEGLKYELIFLNHGSTDDTRAYFESCHPDKQMDIFVNGGGVGAFERIVEGEFTMLISNDVLVLPHVIENLLACMRSDSKIAWAVPTTPNVSNLQSIDAQYETQEEMIRFAEQNNRLDRFRWEERSRLCNPIDIRRSSVFYSSQGVSMNGCFHSVDYMSFPDDRTSLLLRRNGYKMMLCKDAYCHHFGSVTLKEEVKEKSKNDEALFYQQGRRTFQQTFGIDPWGTGFCFDPEMLKELSLSRKEHTEILGLNCGLFSNPLKIKEELKEKQHNLDVVLWGITDHNLYHSEQKSLCDQSFCIASKKQLEQSLEHRKFHYIVWEDPFQFAVSAERIFSFLIGHLENSGVLVMDAKLLKWGKISSAFAHARLIKGIQGRAWYLVEKVVR